MMNRIMHAAITSIVAVSVAGIVTGCKCFCRKSKPRENLTIAIVPANQIVPIGGNITLTLSTTNFAPLLVPPITYQWDLNGVLIPGATGPTYNISNFQLPNVGRYKVHLTGNGGSSTESQNADLLGGLGDPSGTSGTLTCGLASFSNNGGTTGCFPSSNGWDKTYTLPGLFHGATAPAQNPDPYPNPTDLTHLTVDTCDALNGTTVETGIVLVWEGSPLDKVCATNIPVCAASGKLTIDTRSIVSNRRYRATVFYKSTTTPPQNITVHWAYQ